MTPSENNRKLETALGNGQPETSGRLTNTKHHARET